MDENAKKIQREIAKDKIQVILSSIAVAVLIIMEFYIMINFKSNFLAMAVGILLMIVALFFLISALLDMSLKQKDIEQEKYEEIYNAQKASYLVIKKSFDEMEQRLRAIEENSALPAEDIINAQKAVAKVTISRSKENTDALMNSNDELINQLVNIQEKLESNNSQMIEKQQSIIKESNFDIQQKIAALTNQLTSIEGKIQNQVPVMAVQPMQQMAMPQSMPVAEEIPMPEEAAVPEEVQMAEEISMPEEIMEETSAEEQMAEMPMEEEPVVDDLGLDLDAVVEEEPQADDLGLDLDSLTEEAPAEKVAEEIVDDLGLDLDAQVEEEPAEELILEEPVAEEIPVEETPVEEIITEEPVAEEAPVEEPVAEEVPVEEAPAEEIIAEEPVAEEIPAEEAPVEEATAEEIVAEEPAAEEIPASDPGADLDALLEEIGETVEETEPEPEPAAEPEPEPEPKEEAIVIPDVGVDLTDPNRVMSPDEIEKLFANI
jgi:hypothetical protein